MRRGEVWTAAGGPGIAGKPRPVVIVQDDRFDATASVTVCGFTTDPTEAPLFRLPVDPVRENGLAMPSRLMVDKITTVARGNLERRLGHLADIDMLRLNRAIVVFLGLAGG
jgi:mRNA interferase MazF